MKLLLAGLGGGYPSLSTSEEERAALEAVATFRTNGNGYLVEQNTRPQTIGYALLDSPVPLGPGCWITTPTSTTRSPAPLSTSSLRAA
jgi:hypothetical protein